MPGKTYAPATADPEIVHVLVSGGEVRGKINNATVREVIAILVARGYSDGQIAYVVNRARRSVARTRNSMGLGAAIPRWAPTNNRHLPVDAPTRPREKG